jgi:hypothetical protein
MINNPHLQNLLLLIGSIVAYNMEGHDDPAWLFLVIFLIFWGWWKDIKVIAAMIAVRSSVEQVTELYQSIENLMKKLKEKTTKK